MYAIVTCPHMFNLMGLSFHVFHFLGGMTRLQCIFLCIERGHVFPRKFWNWSLQFIYEILQFFNFIFFFISFLQVSVQHPLIILFNGICLLHH